MIERRRRWVTWPGTLLVLTLVGCAPAASAPARPPAAAAPAVSADARAAQTPAGLQPLIDAARQEGQLALIWGEGSLGGSDGGRRLAEGFNRTYGLDVRVQYTPGPSMSEMLAKTTQEFQANRRASTDVQLGFGLHVAALMRAGALLAVDWA